MIGIAFKEWAVICRALAEGRQSIIIRKGGIAEEGGQFRPEHNRFLLYPTFFHEQHRQGVKSDLLPLYEAAEADRPPAGTIRFDLVAEVSSAIRIDELDQALALTPLHGWSDDTIRQRFHYRTPGLYVLPVRIYKLPQTVTVPELPEYAGCKTWVHLANKVLIEGALPVIEDQEFDEICSVVTSCKLP